MRLESDHSQPVEMSAALESRAWIWADRLAVWFTLVLWSLVRIPVPGVNEPHYWGKAKHWWNPQWCAGDFFLDSSNPHLFFYATFGSLTCWFPLEQAAIIGRILGLLILAIGWQHFVQTLLGGRWTGLMTMILFLCLQTIGNFSGEWLVGGMESKVPAYGFLFWGLGEWWRGRPVTASAFLGLSICFHPIVGLWGVIALAMSEVGFRIWGRRAPLPSDGSPVASFTRRQLLASIAVGALIALPGLVAGVSALQGATAEESRIANQLQVGDRLAHHLDPMRFPKSAYWFAGSLLVIWLLLSKEIPGTIRQRRWQCFVVATILIALAGIVLGFGPRPVAQMPGHVWRLALLKFYPFRLGDLFLPVAFSLAMVQAARSSSWRFARPLLRLGVIAAVIGALFIAFPDENPSRLSPQEYRDWGAACQWIRDQTPTDSIVYAADNSWGLKWLTHRPEFVNYKDMPQDAARIVQWNERLWVIARWRIAAVQDGSVSEAELADLRRQTGIRYLLASRFGPIDAKPVFERGGFRVYELPEPAATAPESIPPARDP